MAQLIEMIRTAQRRTAGVPENAFDSDEPFALEVTPDGSEYLCVALVRGVWTGLRLAPGDVRRWNVVEMASLAQPGSRLTPEGIRSVPIGRLVVRCENLIASGGPGVGRRARAEASRLTGATQANLSAFLNGAPGVRISDVDYALLAFEYLQLAEAGNRSPAKYLSERFGHGSAPQWSNRLGEARRRGLLSKGERGLVGGHLTEKAEALLGL